MKQAWMTAVILGFTLASTPAQSETGNAEGGSAEAVKESAFTVTKRGAHHKVWERIEYEPGPGGKLFPRKHSYTELATGMHFKNAQGEWEESKEEIEILPNDAGAVANKGQHKAIFPPEIKSGLIELQTPDQKWMRSRVWGLAYFDSTTGKSVLLAEVNESEGKIVGNNVVIYPNAFSDFVADIRYTYTRAGFEQDVVLRERPPAPESFNMNPKTTRLQVLTEFVEAQTPTKQRLQAGGLADETLRFGAMDIGFGKAFSVEADGDSNGHVPVAKQWERIEGRDFLIEQVLYEKVARQLERLPAASKHEGARLERRGQGDTVLAGLKQMMPKRYARATPPPIAKPKRMAKTEPQSTPSFVMDYITITSQTNYTFLGDTTYLINGTVNLSGTTTVEGNTVIKFAKTNTARININDPQLVLRTGTYRPAVFTAKDDNSVGESVGGSGSPSGYYGGGVYYAGYSGTNPVLDNFRFCYLQDALVLGVDDSQNFAIANLQFGQCQNALYYGGGLTAQNCLFTKIGTVLNTVEEETACLGEHWTVNQCNVLNNAWKSTLQLDNCLLVAVTNLDGSGVYLCDWVTNEVANVSNPSEVFQTAGGGDHYLVANSPYRNVGTTNIDATLLASLTKKTTYPPIAYTNVTFTTPTTFNPQAQRDTDTPDLGYHYDPLDYSLGGCAASANLTFAAGTAVGWFRTTSGWQYAGQAIRMIGNIVVSFEGTATAPTYFVRLNTVQENDRTAGYGHGGIENWEGPAYPTVRGRFLRCTAMAGEVFNGYFADDYGGIRAEMTHTEFWSGSLQTYGDYMYYTNCLMWRLGFVGMVAGGSDSAFVMRNCTMIGGRLEMQRNGPSPVLVLDGAFDGTTISMADSYGSNPSYTTCDYNAYTNTSNPFPLGGVHNVPVSSSFKWQTGPFGNFYLPTNSTLINTGSVFATNIALYHFTTQTNQTKEAASKVDIGYHYVAVDGNGVPLDSDSDGLVDYLEDTNGDGNYNQGDLANWNSADTDGDGIDDRLELETGRDPRQPGIGLDWFAPNSK